MSSLTEHGLLPNRAGEGAHRELHAETRGEARGLSSCKSLAEAALVLLLASEDRTPRGATVRVPWEHIYALRDAFDQWATSYFGGPDRATFKGAST